MKRDDIFKSIDEKLTPGSRAERELFERASELKPGEKYIGSAEEVFLTKGIIPEKEIQETKAPAIVTSRRPAIAAAAAAIVLVLGAAVFFGISSHRGVETDSSVPSQRTEESKTDKETVSPGMNDDTKNDRFWETAKELLEKCSDEYEASGADYKVLPSLHSFKELRYESNGIGTVLCIYDLYQNGDVDDKTLFIAANMLNCGKYAEEVESKNNTLENEQSGFEYFIYVNEEYMVNNRLSEFISDDDPEREDYKNLFEKIAAYKDNYKSSKEYRKLIELGKKYGDFNTKITAMYIVGDIDDSMLDVAYEAAKEICVQENDIEDALRDISEISGDELDYYKDILTNDPKQLLKDEYMVEEWVLLKLRRLAAVYDEGKDISEDVNYKSIKALGSFTAQRAILSAYEFDEFDRDYKMTKIAAQLLADVGWDISIDKMSDDKDKLYGVALDAYDNCAHADYYRGVCDGNYKECGRYLLNRDAFDALYEALASLPKEGGDGTYTTKLSDPEVKKAKENAYAYVDIYDCTEHCKNDIRECTYSLYIIIPDKSKTTVIIGDTKYSNISEDTFEHILNAVEGMMHSEGTKQERVEFTCAALTLAQKEGSVSVTSDDADFCGSVYAFAAFVRENSLGGKAYKAPKQLEEDGISVTFCNAKGEEAYSIIIPDRYARLANDGYSLYIGDAKYQQLDVTTVRHFAELITNKIEYIEGSI